MLKRSILLICIILILDQALKFYIKTNFFIGQEQPLLGNFFKLYFIENPGMAFGLSFGGNIGKILLTIVRILAATFIAFFLVKSINKKEHKLLILSISLIFAGAFGNIIDSVFYGLIFSASDFFLVAEFLPEGGGYAGLFQGNVVDMFFAPIIHSTWPQWVPFIGGNEFIFFRFIFNIADASITIGVFILIIFYNRIFKTAKKNEAIEQANTQNIA